MLQVLLICDESIYLPQTLLCECRYMGVNALLLFVHACAYMPICIPFSAKLAVYSSLVFILLLALVYSPGKQWLSGLTVTIFFSNHSLVFCFKNTRRSLYDCFINKICQNNFLSLIYLQQTLF